MQGEAFIVFLIKNPDAETENIWRSLWGKEFSITLQMLVRFMHAELVCKALGDMC